MHPPSPEPDPRPAPVGVRWLSRDYAELRSEKNPEPFDVLIVGSGYGGAMAAAELAGRHVLENGVPRPVRIAVLERGNEYAPGMFASSLQELPPHVRVHRSSHDKTIGPLDALLDVRVGEDVCTLVGNGLGGGSLINAGVMQEPDLETCERLPRVLRDELTPERFARVKERLGATTDLHRNPDMPPGGLPKTVALKKLYEAARQRNPARKSGFAPAAITVQAVPDESDQDVPACTLCGDCMTGCNVGAKKSLDTTLLREARRKGVRLYTGGSVLQVQKNNGKPARGQAQARWKVTTVYTDESMRRRHRPFDILAHRVILAAGTLGSTEILLRSRSFSLPLSDKLGEQFSCNGDNMVALHEGPEEVRSTSEEHQPLRGRAVGPTITSVLKMDGFLIEEFAVPAALRRLFEQTVTTARLLNDLGKPPAGMGPGGCDSFAVNPQAMDRTLLVGLIGHDEGCGQLQLPEPRRMDDSRQLEGRVHVHWPDARHSLKLERAFADTRALVEEARQGPAPVLPNPMWRLLPEEMEFLVKGERGPLFTVHPLGGCPMGEAPDHGVVDDRGRVFDPRASELANETRVHDGLVVLDGSIIPGSLGANPSLTIAAVAQRAAGLLAAEWGFVAPPPGVPLEPLGKRPVFREPEHCTPAQPRATEVELTERLVGKAGSRLLELTLRYQPETVKDLMSGRRPRLDVDEARSFLRIYPWDKDTERRLITWPEPRRDDEALLIARVGGDLDILRQIPGTSGWRRAGAFLAWVGNRGTRELWDALRKPGNFNAGLIGNSSARAGEARCFDYEVVVGEILKTTPDAGLPVKTGDIVRGHKRLTYRLWGNPWRQLTEVRLLAYPWGLGRLPLGPLSFLRGSLKLDGRFLARQGFPLIRITKQENQIVALADVAEWAACWTRMLVSIHLWSFRAPDVAPAAAPQLLPATRPPKLTLARQVLQALFPASKLPAPEIHEVELEPPRRGVPVRMRLTRYAKAGTRKPPVVLIHGYSASGSTFTHHAIPKPLALYLHEHGYDVWVLDLRTSAGLPSGRLPWHFEDAALADIPKAIALVRELTGAPKVDVFAHCIGAVMLSMALLTHPSELWKFEQVDPADGGPRPKRYCQELRALRGSIRRVVLSQKAPNLVYSDGNVLRAYFMRVLRQAILPEDYQFTVPTEEQGLAGGLLDRILSTIPYPTGEFRRENPFWRFWKRTPWAGFRHRMDALYARDFSLKNISDRTLASIHDLFGPLNLDTVAQAIHFARSNTITDGAGRAIDTQAGTLAARWPRGGTLLIHGIENGLADVATTDVFASHMERAGLQPRVQVIPGYGHQDCLIGEHAHDDVFPHITRFLEEERNDESPILVDDPFARAGA